MDDSSRYVLLCDKADMLQRLWSIQLGDWFALVPRVADATGVKVAVVGVVVDRTFTSQVSAKVVWLPRFDQLVKLVKAPIHWWSISVSELGWHVVGRRSDSTEFYPEVVEFSESPEQALLHTVMYCRWNKHWDRSTGEWV